MNRISFRINYDAFPCNNELEDFNGIQEFRNELSENYVTNIRGFPVGRGGFAYELIIEAILSISLEDFVKFILSGVAFDLIRDGTKEFMLKPFFIAFNKLNAQNRNLIKVREIRFFFEDTEIIIKAIDDKGIYHIIPLLIENIVRIFPNLRSQETGRFPSKMHLPVIFDNNHVEYDGIVGYRQPIVEEEYITGLTHEDYFKYWGLFYEFVDKEIVISLNDLTEIASSYYTDVIFETYIFPKVMNSKCTPP